MTVKQENILNAALELFATEGYNAVATSKIAKKAGVSEGLIFRHFGNKEGLLNAIMELGKAEAFKQFAQIFRQSDPKDVIRATIEMSLTVSEEQQHFWRLIYALKWQRRVYDDSLTMPVRQALTAAFEELGYENAAAEAEVVLMFIDGLAMSVLLKQLPNLPAIIDTILKRYELI